MKHLKLYEDWDMLPSIGEWKYKAGDYIVLGQPGRRSYWYRFDNSDADRKWMVYPCAKVLDKNSNQNRHDEEPNIDYYIETFLLDNPSMIENFWVDEEEIEDLATSEEIEEYEMRKDAKRYNV